MAIHGISKEPWPFWFEEENDAPMDERTLIWTRPRKGHDANKVLSAYAAAGREGRKGYRDLNARKLDDADVTAFLSAVAHVDRYHFGSDFKWHNQGIIDIPEGDVEKLTDMCRDLESAKLIEYFEAVDRGPVSRQLKKD